MSATRLRTAGYELVPMDEHLNDTTSRPVVGKPKRKLVRISIIGTCAILSIVLSSLGILHIVIVLAGHSNFFGIVSGSLRYSPDSYPRIVSSAVIKNTTQDITPIPCHSHNDYWRNVPLFDAISVGCTSVEADVWYTEGDDELYVGHKKGSRSEDRTLKSLYIDPIMDMLDERNSNDGSSNLTTVGVFDVVTEQMLVLLIDFKSDPTLLLPLVQNHLEPLREKGYLSFWDGSGFVAQPITVVLTGNLPLAMLNQTSIRRDVFLDAPLAELWKPSQDQQEARDTTQPSISSWNSSTAYYASTSFKKTIGHPSMGRLTSKQLETIRGQIREAQSRGLKARYWDTPAWPVSLRNYIWKTLLEEGADVLNVDDLYAAAFLDWRRVEHGWVNG